MKREKLLRSKDYIVAQLQLQLLNLIGNYKDEKKLKDYQLAEELGVSKGYVSQLLNATYDHKLSKVVDLALACNSMPLLYFVDLDKFIQADSNEMVYEIFPAVRKRNIHFESPGTKEDYVTINSSEANDRAEDVTKGYVNVGAVRVTDLMPSIS